ncbi:hypothetical protein [Actinoallomurus iriomotensis]|uniref:hypothetical protein n=1 Tax=Actinoallomurus iriomotensis TaxID=478107 RepID=UPI002557C0B4|nr:hypothetical protein [Actinoallomurus iriomotensis]
MTLALDFRGLTSRHSRRSVEMMWWFIGGNAEAKQRRVEQQTILERVIGACFALAGLAAVLNALLRW